MKRAEAGAQLLSNFAADVRRGLGKEGQKELPAKYFYDELGTALYEAITMLPEYGLTRAGARLLRRHAEQLLDRLPLPIAVAELGSGSSRLTRWLLEAFARRQATLYFPIDLSPAAMARCVEGLGGVRRTRVLGIEKDYLDGLEELVTRRPAATTLLVLFLGSTIGNFNRGEAQAFLGEVRARLQAGDALLLGTDLEKPPEALLLAYDDPLGVTAAFNLNLLARINRELQADFALWRFRHRALFNEDERRIEMHLCSTTDQTVHIRAAELTVRLCQEETIWTESCHKFNPAEVIAMGERAGFTCQAQWVDSEWPFAHTLFAVRG